MSAHHRTTEWAKLTRTMRPIIKATLPAPCIDCGWPITPDQKWQIGHRVSVGEGRRRGWSRQQIDSPSNLGPSHAKGPGQRACNQIAGGRLGAAQRNRVINRETPRTTERMPKW